MNKNLFKSSVVSTPKGNLPRANTVNAAGGEAYSMSDEHALSQLACTGTFNGTFYVEGSETLNEVLALANRVNPEFLAKVCVYARQSAFMKDTSATLLAVLASRDIDLFKAVFDRVIDNGKMLKNFCQVIRSGVTGRKSFGSGPKKKIEAWLASRSDKQLLEDSVGTAPSLADVIKMVHPKPVNEQRDAFYSYLIGKTAHQESLPEILTKLETFKGQVKGSRFVPRNIPFQMLTALDLSEVEWCCIARDAKWHMTRMNLNTFARHGVFKEEGMTDVIAERLANRENVLNSKVFPYQLFTAYQHAEDSIPVKVKNALQDAMEVATENVPAFKGKVIIAVDCSGSMNCPVTGNRGTVSTKVTCNQVASLIAACVLRKSEQVEVLRFDTKASYLSLNPRDTVVTNCQKIGFNGGGTDVSSPVKLATKDRKNADLFIIVSDNESWAQSGSYGATALQVEWQAFKKNNPNAKLICIDLAANTSTQAASSPDTLNLGGFSDSMFTVISAFVESNGSPSFWTDKIKSEVTL